MKNGGETGQEGLEGLHAKLHDALSRKELKRPHFREPGLQNKQGKNEAIRLLLQSVYVLLFQTN